MNTPVQNARTIMLDNPQLSYVLLDFLLWSVKPGVVGSDDYDDVLSEIFINMDEFRAARDLVISSRAA